MTPPNTPPEDVMELDEILKPLLSLRGISPEESTRLQREDLESAKSKLTKYIEQQVLIGRLNEAEISLLKFSTMMSTNYGRWQRDRLAELDRQISKLTKDKE